MLRWLIILPLCLLSLLARAEAEVPPLTARVTDLTGTLTQEQRSDLEARLAAFEQEKGSQIAVLIVPTTRPETIEQYSIRVAEQWKLGRKGVDDGVLVLLAKEDRTVRIEVGYGLEGALPDVIAKRIIEDSMVPHFRAGDFYGGLAAGIDHIIGVLRGEALPAPRPRGSDGVAALGEALPLLFMATLVAGLVLRAVLGNFMGGLLNGGLMGLIAWGLTSSLVLALLVGVFAFIITLGGGHGIGGGLGRGTLGGGFGGGGGFSGGGGGFGGGGASGRW